MNFDWYGATVEAEPDELLGALLHQVPMSSARPCRGINGFERAQEVYRGDQSFVRVYWDGRGDAAGTGTFVQGSGRHAPFTAAFLRESTGRHIAHRVARADVAIDYKGPGSWDVISSVLLNVCDLHGIKVEHAGDWHRCEAGRTLYGGGRDSLSRVCAYEKGRQLGEDPDWVRLELRVRPKGRGKETASFLQPSHFFGVSTWTVTLAERLFHSEIERINVGTVWTAEDQDRARASLVRQYGPTLLGLLEENGSWAGVGEWLGARVTAKGN